MPITPRTGDRPPDAWQVHGHSYFQNSFGTRAVNGRADALLRAALDIELPNWQNWAMTGAKLTGENASYNCLPSLYTAVRPSPYTQAAPFVYYGGAKVFCWGINDYGARGGATLSAAFRRSMVHHNRAAIDWCRASVYYETNATQLAYSAGWSDLTGTSIGENWTATRNALKRSSTTTPTITFTIPAGFLGGAITFKFIVNSGTAGGTVTFSGTSTPGGAGKALNGVAAGTTVQLADWGFSDGTHSSGVARISGFTSANAGQTIICTVSQIDAGGFVDFDGVTLEGVNPGPIVVCNIAKLTTAAYNGYAAIAANTDAVDDANIDILNADLLGVVAEFDSMVTVADIDSKMNSTTGGRTETMSSDGLHPNELGAALICDSILEAAGRLYPSSRFGKTAQYNTPAARWGEQIVNSRSGQWYTAYNGGRGADYTAVAGDTFALPIMVQRPDANWNQWAVELNASTAAPTIAFCIYDDRNYSGYPQRLYQDITFGPLGGVALALAIGAGAKLSSTTPGQNGYLAQAVDPGLYWLVMKVISVGTGTVFRTVRGQNPYLPMLTAGAMVPAAAATPGGNMGWKGNLTAANRLPSYFPTTGFTPAGDIPMIGLKYA